jgi:uncharacterized iron-regulated membrane protein
MSSPAPRATAAGAPRSLEDIIAAARAAAPDAKGSVFVSLPEKTGDAATVRFLQNGRDGRARMGRSPTIFVDPVSAAVIGTRTRTMSPLVQFAHDLHGQLFLGRDGRPLVGWLGVGMVILGLSGLVLWWPKPHQWKAAFIVRRTAKGLRFHRELHAAVGIWAFVVFIVVSFTGVAIAFPDSIRTLAGGGPTAFNLRTGPEIAPMNTEHPVSADEAVAHAEEAVPGTLARSVVIPAADTQAISVALARKDGDPTILTMVYVDPYRGKVVAVRDPSTLAAADRFMAWQRPLHEGDALGAVGHLLVFLTGFLPLVFVVTGLTMWIKKRRAHISMAAPLPDTVLAEGAAP